jgi:hypothetical protein
VRLSTVVTKRRMPVGKKAILVQLSIWVLGFGFCVALGYRSQVALCLIVIGLVMLMTWSTELKCPRCKHTVGTRPLKWLHDFGADTICAAQ